MTSRALIVKFGAIGDVIMAVPAAWQLHRAGNQIDWVCGLSLLPILELYPWINPIPADERAILLGTGLDRARALARLWRTLAGRRYDLAATLYYDARYRLLTLPVRATRRLQLSPVDRTRRLLPGRHHTDEYARILLGRTDGLEPTSLAPVPVPPERLPPTPLPRDQRARVVLAPGGARNLMTDDALRRWPAELYAILAGILLREGIDVILIGGPDDAWVQPHFAPLATTDLIGRLSLQQTMALLHEADLLVTHDTGPLHMAGITSCGILGLFGPTDPRGRLPQRAGTAAIWGGEGFACRPCYDGRSFAPCPANECLSRVTPGMVLAEIKRMLAERARGWLGPPRIITPESTVPAAHILDCPALPLEPLSGEEA